jgi:hypothetical protein
VKDGSVDYIDVDASTGALTIKKVGSATVIVTAAETATYEQATKEVTVTINKANAVPSTVTANNRTYDGTEKPLVTVTGKTTGGTLKFAVTTEDQEPAADAYNFDTTSIPTATDAGTYYVWYKVIASEDYLDSEPVCIVVTISKEAEPEQKNVLVVKNKIRITNLFSKYGESGYKYKFKVEDKSQRKIASVTQKGKISVKKVGSVKVSLFRKAKKGKWEKVEEQTVKTELPAVTKRITDLKVGDTLEASSFITNQSELLNKPTSYKSTNKKVATVDSTTGKITILKKGNTRIRIIYGTGNGSAVYTTRLRVK